MKPKHDLFVYGTLRDAELVKRLTGRVFDTHTALLPGYRKVSPSDSYPYIVADASAHVEGWLLINLDSEALSALDHYEAEGELYRRTVVEVVVSGQPRTAMTYVGIAEAYAAIPRR